MATIYPESATRRAGAAGLMIFLGVAAVVASLSPALHQFFHQDSQNGHHECLVTQLSKSQVSGAGSPGQGLICSPLGLLLVSAEASTQVSASDYALRPGRGPPSSMASLTAVG